ncbi:MAG: hypothetical protein OHK0012_11440 [Synechococcales cyanobacterium]
MLIPISTVFVGLHGLMALALSYLVVMERTRTRLWHGESQTDVINQPNYLAQPNPWAAFVERYTQKAVITKTADDGVLQRKVRAYGNFTEYVPLGLLFIIALELMGTSPWILWGLGGALTLGRVAHAWGLTTTYGPSPGRAIGFFLTWFVYLAGASACLYYGIAGLLSSSLQPNT